MEDASSCEMSEARRAMEFRVATGMGLMEARTFLREQDTELCARIVCAHKEQSWRGQGGRGSGLYDPIEDKEEFRERIKAAKAAAEEEYREWLRARKQERIEKGVAYIEREWPRGSCHAVWNGAKRRLAEQGILWYSPREMNPCSIID